MDLYDILGQRKLVVVSQQVQVNIGHLGRHPFGKGTVLVGACVGFGVAAANVRLPGPVDPARLLIRAEKAVFEQLSGTLRPAPELC